MEEKNQMHNIIQDGTNEQMKALEVIFNLLKITFGGAGTSVKVEDFRRPGYQIVSDFETIIQAVKMDDIPEHRLLLKSIKELSAKQDKTAGNGRKTAVLMAMEILRQVYANKPTQSSLFKLKEELDTLIPFIESEIDKRTTKITVDNVLGVATTASRSKEIGKLLQEIYPQIGTNGILSIEGSKTYETSYQITNGVRFAFTGMLSPEMVYDEEAVKEGKKATKTIFKNPVILITKKKIVNDDEINPLLKELVAMEKSELVIFTNDMDSTIASSLVNIHKNGGYTDNTGNFRTLHVVIIKAPSLWQDYIFEDFAKCVGATIVEDKTGVSFKNLDPLKHLGTCDRIEVDQEDTILTGIKDLTEHMKALQEKGDDDSLLRLSWLASKSALLKLGSNSEVDLSYKRLKANDANRSTYLALQYGVVKGGGVCLYEIANHLPDTEAGKILAESLQAPLTQAMVNYGVTPPIYFSLITEDIVDASETVKKAVRNAISIASTFITAPSIVYIPKKTPEEMAYEIAVKQNNPFGQN